MKTKVNKVLEAIQQLNKREQTCKDILSKINNNKELGDMLFDYGIYVEFFEEVKTDAFSRAAKLSNRLADTEIEIDIDI